MPTDIMSKLKKARRPYRMVELTAGDPGAVAGTKIGGAPWWPKDVERPRCVDGHLMAFVAQVRLSDVPRFEWQDELLSFHYCYECPREGNMAWGWQDKGSQLRYNVRVLQVAGSQADGLGVVANQRDPAFQVELYDDLDGPSLYSIWNKYPETTRRSALPDGALKLNDNKTKLGGWPSWDQDGAKHPEDKWGERLSFVAQLDLYTCPNSPWCCGHAYLFASKHADEEASGELIIQTT